jgi:hypothetical protein
MQLDILRVPDEQQVLIEHPENIGDEDIYDTDILEVEWDGVQPFDVNRSDAIEEDVQCEVLRYGNSWSSTAKRTGNVGVITGSLSGEEYIGDTAEEAYRMNALLYPATQKRRIPWVRTIRDFLFSPYGILWVMFFGLLILINATVKESGKDHSVYVQRIDLNAPGCVITGPDGQAINLSTLKQQDKLLLKKGSFLSSECVQNS